MSREPRRCPFCGTDIDARRLGGMTREYATKQLAGDGRTETWDRWERYRCRECDEEFALLDKRVQFQVGADGEEIDGTRTLLADGGTVQDVQDGEVLAGEIELVSPVTGRPYTATRWINHGDGRVTALEKEPIEDRLFVPLKTRPYRAFAAEEKDIELRGLNANFNPETVTPGRWSELRHGYSGDSLWRRVEHIWLFDHLTNIAEAIDHTRVLPDSTRDEFEASVEELLGDYGRWIAFQVRKPVLPGDVRP